MFETRRGGRQGEGTGRMTVLARGLSRLSPAAGTYIRFGAGGVFRRFRNSLRRMSWRPGLAPRESIWSDSRKFSRIGFQLGRHKMARKRRLQKGETPRSEKSPGGGIRLGIRNRAEACGGALDRRRRQSEAGRLRQEDRKGMTVWEKRKEAGAATVEPRRKRHLAHFPNRFGLMSGTGMMFA